MTRFTVVFNTHSEDWGGHYILTNESDFVMAFMASVLSSGWTVESVSPANMSNVGFELMPQGWEPEPPPTDFDTAELYEQRCEITWDENGDEQPECGGRVVAVGGNGYYNGSYDCYTLTLECEKCGIYDVECV